MSLRGRAILVSLVALLAIGLAYPNLFGEQQRLDSDWIPDQAVNLGLDLQGGIHWLLRIDADKAVHDELVTVEGRLRENAETDGVAFTSIELDGEGARVLVTGADEDALQKLIDDRFDSLALDSADDGLVGHADRATGRTRWSGAACARRSTC